MAANLLEKLRQILLDMHHSGNLSEIDPGLYEDAREYIEKLKTDYYSLENPLENRAGSLLIEEIGSVRDTVQEIFSIRLRQILALAFQQIDGLYFDKEEARKMLPAERAMYRQVIDAIEDCRDALLHGEEFLFSGNAPMVMDEADDLSQAQRDPQDSIQRPDPHPYAIVRICSDTEPFMGVDGRVYTLKKRDIVTLPESNADVLCEHNIALNIRLNK